MPDVQYFFGSNGVKDKSNNSNRRYFLKTVGVAGLTSVLASTQAGNSSDGPGKFRRMEMVTKREVNRAIKILKRCLDIHRKWIERFEHFDGEEKMLGSLLGDIDHHKNYVIEYEFIINLLESIKQRITV